MVYLPGDAPTGTDTPAHHSRHGDSRIRARGHSGHRTQSGLLFATGCSCYSETSIGFGWGRVLIPLTRPVGQQILGPGLA